MSCHDADQLPYTRCLHGKRPCHQQDVNRRCIPSVTAAMTESHFPGIPGKKIPAFKMSLKLTKVEQTRH